MAWLQNFKIGILGSELDILAKVLAPNFEIKNVEQVQRNISGGLRRDVIRSDVGPTVLQTAAVPMSTLARLRGFYQSRVVLNFKANDAFAVTDQLETSSDSTHVPIANTSATGIVIAGVFLKVDVARALTNYFNPGGTYNATTGIITLGTALPSANEDVWIDYAFAGQAVMITRLNAVPHEAQNQNLWKVNFELTGA